VWIDYLLGKSDAAMQIIDYSSELFVLSLNICEMTSKLLRQGFEPENYMQQIRSMTTVLFIDGFEEKIGVCHAKMREIIPNFGLVDAAMMVLADEHSLTILTKDTHFKAYKKVKLIV
jgi:PIN domain nuclease of toxin-antitoxin system